MSSKIKRKGPGVKELINRVKKPGTVQAGIIDSGPHEGADITVAGIGFAHEFGAEINHPGGTPYVIGKDGKAKFVSIDRGGAVAGFTKPHSITIPERSFIRSTIHSDRKKILALNKKLLKKIVNGDMEVKQALGILGAFVADKISQKIVSLKSPPNKPGTILAKGSSNPLVDTGQLKNSITWEVNP